MKKVLLLPTSLFPYMVCLCLGYVLIAQDFSNTTIQMLGILALATLMLSIVCNLIYIFTAKSTSASELLKLSFIIKIIHIPTYILIYVLGVIMGFMFFMTLPFILFLVLIDLITLWLSGMISVYSLAKSLKVGDLCSKPLLIVTMVCQLFFCADIISMFIVRIVVKKNKVKAA